MKFNYQNKLLQLLTNATFLIVLLVGVSNCKKFLKIPSPRTELETPVVFSNSATANASILSIYSKMINERGFPYNLSLYTGSSSDELNNYSTIPELAAFYTNSLTAINTNISSEIWTPAYNYIYSANAILEGVSTSGSLTKNLKNQLLGEAKFLRAFWYFNLVNLFGDVPLITSTDYTKSMIASRTPVTEIYQQIIADLKDAKELLNENYVDVDGLTSSSEKVRANKWAASALLSRVYLYTKAWAAAENEATNVISNPEFQLNSLDSVFLANSSETIWALQPVSNDPFSTPEAANYILTGDPNVGSFLNATISPNLLDAFESKDNRKVEWIGTYGIYTFPYKYKQRAGSSLTEYSIVLRLAEQYLIRSEARTQQGNIPEGLKDVNKVRNRAGLSDTTTTGKDQLLDIILHERQVELFSEYGHRWFDLKRTGKIDQTMTTLTPQKGGIWSPYKRLFPIPQKELDSDPNLQQNDGYQ